MTEISLACPRCESTPTLQCRDGRHFVLCIFCLSTGGEWQTAEEATTNWDSQILPPPFNLDEYVHGSRA